MNDTKRVAVITGGAQGIGRRTAELLAERGFRIAIIDLQDAMATVAAIEAHGGERWILPETSCTKKLMPSLRRRSSIASGASMCW